MGGGAHWVPHSFFNFVKICLSISPIRMTCPHPPTVCDIRKFSQLLSKLSQPCMLFLQSSSRVLCTIQLPRPLESKLCISETHPIPVCPSCPLPPTGDSYESDSDSGASGVSQDAPSLTLIEVFIDSESKGRSSGKITGGEIGMESSCNHRLLGRIFGDFLSQWVADFKKKKTNQWHLNNHSISSSLQYLTKQI